MMRRPNLSNVAGDAVRDIVLEELLRWWSRCGCSRNLLAGVASDGCSGDGEGAERGAGVLGRVLLAVTTARAARASCFGRC